MLIGKNVAATCSRSRIERMAWQRGRLQPSSNVSATTLSVRGPCRTILIPAALVGAATTTAMSIPARRPTHQRFDTEPVSFTFPDGEPPATGTGRKHLRRNAVGGRWTDPPARLQIVLRCRDGIDPDRG